MNPDTVVLVYGWVNLALLVVNLAGPMLGKRWPRFAGALAAIGPALHLLAQALRPKAKPAALPESRDEV